MASPDIFFGPGDTAPVLTDTLLGPDGTPLDLTGATVTFRYSSWDGNGPLIQEEATIVGDETDGTVSWQPVAELATGKYNCDWHVVLGSADVMTVPNDRNLLMQVKAPPRP